MIRRLPAVRLALTLALAASGAWAQDAPRPAERPSRGLADRLGRAWQDEEPAQDTRLARVGSQFAAALGGVDRERMSSLEGELMELRSMATELETMLADLDRGLPVAIDPWPGAGATDAPVDAEAISDEERVLIALEAELARRRLEAKRAAEAAERRERARRVTPRGEALLATDAAIPAPPPAKEETGVEVGPHAVRLAEALYDSGDYRGAARQLEGRRSAEKGGLTPRHLYLLARCHEELGQLDQADAALGELMTAVPDENAFWHRRAKSMRALIANSGHVNKVLGGSKR
ncbi:MAG: CDC27 family protein [Planctomycetota bacterium]